ncbi:hypothetical protein SAMN05216447_1081, partial [Parafannyhessea umbonata]
ALPFLYMCSGSERSSWRGVVRVALCGPQGTAAKAP